MKRLLVTLAVLAALAAPASALAHPLGNFTVNRQTEIELSGGRVYVHYALDLAEIPTFQLGDARPRRRLRARGGARSRAPRSTAAAHRCACSSGGSPSDPVPAG